MSSARTFDVVGLNHRLTKVKQTLLAEIIESSNPLKCQIHREPENLHDPNAIMVVVKDARLKKADATIFATSELHIGYFRREVAAVLAQGLDKGTMRITSCRLTEVNVEHGWGRVRVSFLKTPASKRKIHT